MRSQGTYYKLGATHNAPRKAEYHVPSLFCEKEGDNITELCEEEGGILLSIG